MYKRVLKLNWDEDEIPRMKRDCSLPTVLAKEEIEVILDTTKNLKYKAIFAVMYSGSLRVSEATHLHYEDIFRKNHSIHIRNTKNRDEICFTNLALNSGHQIPVYARTTSVLLIATKKSLPTAHINAKTMDNDFVIYCNLFIVIRTT